MKRRGVELYSTLNVISTVLIVLFLLLGYFVISSGTIHNSIVSVDRHVQVFVLTHSSPSLRSEMNVITEFGSAPLVVFFQIVLLAILLKYREEAIALISTSGLLIGELSGLILKQIIARDRPYVSDIGIGYAFPSAHALMSLLFYGFAAYMLARSAPKLWQKYIIAISASLLILLVGYSRLTLNVHWFSDVVGGWLLGGGLLVMLIVATHRIREWHRKHWHPDRALVLVAVACVSMIIGFMLAYDFVIYVPAFRSIIM